MMLLIALLVQTAPLPDIELNAHATVREVRIQQRGETSLTVHASPDAGSDVRVDKPQANGRARLRNVTVNVHAEARIAAPAQNPVPVETPSPQ